MSWRHHLVAIGFCCLVVILAGRVAYLGVEQRGFLKQQGDARAVRTETLRAQRGVVRDRWGEPLAISTPVYTAWADPSLSDLSDEEVNALAEVLSVPSRDVQARFSDKERQFVYLKRRMGWPQANRVRDLDIDGVFVSTEYQRYYPAGETAAHVVGLTGRADDGVAETGLEGVERAFNEHLHGQSGRKRVVRDRDGNNVRDLEYLAAPRFGQDLELTIDLRLQFLAYRELKSAVEGHGARSGSLVMLDARTGEILALANQPSFNPNEPISSYHGLRNRAVTDVYEPGSTVKPFAVLAALESGAFGANSIIDTAPGYMWVGNKMIQDPLNRGEITLTQALQKSSQVAIAKLALALEPRSLFDVLGRAGAGFAVGSGLPGESDGRFSDARLSSDLVRVTMAYGYGLSLSPLQLAQAYLTLAAQGQRLPISIVRQAERPPAPRAFNGELARTVLEMMETVTSEAGTAPKARVPGYSVSGKTGTARVVGSQGYDDERHVALFAGVVPIRDPRLVMVVVINEPTGGLSGGGDVAAPIFARVAGRSLRLMGVPAEPELDIAAVTQGARP